MKRLLEMLAPKWEVESNEIVSRPVTFTVKAWSRDGAIRKAIAGQVEEAIPKHHLTSVVELEVISARRAK
jgi:hypothetical protein